VGKFKTQFNFRWRGGNVEFADVVGASGFLTSFPDELKQGRDYDQTLQAVQRALHTDAMKDVMEADEALQFFIRKLPR
jgi:hypothetical protein